jgi:hypothetical protein
MRGRGPLGEFRRRRWLGRPHHGDSRLAQTFTVPSGANVLSFYYKVVCPDTLTYLGHGHLEGQRGGQVRDRVGEGVLEQRRLGPADRVDHRRA